MLNYVKKECEGKLSSSYNSRVRMKKLAQFYGEIDGNGNNDGAEEWIYVNSPDDLVKHDIDVDFTKLHYKPLFINNCDDVQ